MKTPKVWFPAIHCGSGADVFTQRLADALNGQGIHAEITWLPHRAEYAPWSVPIPKAPDWATIVHVNTWLHPRFIPPHLPVVATMHHVVHDPAFAPYRTRAQMLYHTLWIKPIEARVLHRANAVTAVSHYTAKQVAAVFGRHNITVIPNGIDTDLFRPGPDRLPHQPFRLLFVGNWSLRKGADLLAPIMQKLGSDFELSVISGLRDWHGNTTLPSNIRFLGRIPTTEALVRIYQETDALLFPSRLEGFGLVALEAMACGTPVIAGKGSALPEVVKDSITGFLVETDDCDAFAERTRQLKQDTALHGKFSHSARHDALAHFSEKKCTLEYIQIYEKILER
jgi:glycosyltransferase involved in cell wall biosynthesis